jgi:hypothetical protein
MIKHFDVPWQSVALCLVALVASSSRALADGVTIQTGWSPFPYFYCSSCGPNVPLTLEQADGVETLIGPAITESELSLPVLGSNGVVNPGEASTTGGAPASSLLPAKPGVALSVSSFGSHELGHSSLDRDGADDRDGVEKSEGLEYDVNVSTGNAGHDGVSAAGDDDDAAYDDNRDQNEGNNPSHGTTTFTSVDVDNISSGNTVSGGGESGESLAPEPTSLILLGSGLALLASRVRRRRSARSDAATQRVATVR